MARFGTVFFIALTWFTTATLCAQTSTHWSYAIPKRLPLPRVQDRSWPHNAIDYFILSRLEAAGFKPSPEADPTSLVRRATLDLIGLPPDCSDVDSYVADASADSYGRVVARLLADPHFGERMSQYWLDAARYADTHGYLIDAHRDMWPWRDWVVSALNQNMPFDQFTVDQLAGDLLPSATHSQQIASGFNRNHMINYENGAFPEQYRAEYVADRVVTVGTVWLGQTFDCARCHDHKYDPITTREFYELFAFFNHVPEEGLDGNRGNAEPTVRVPTVQQQERWAERKKRSAQIEQLRAERRAAAANEHDAAFRRLTDELNSIRRQIDLEEQLAPSVMTMKELDVPRETFVLLNGEFDRRGEKVEAGTPASLHAWPENAPRNRLGLARWIVDQQNPLTARVIVNRIWLQFFGNGLVRTPEDFGLRGEIPTHPELLDWLAVEFMESGWDTKHIVRLIVTSATYCQASRVRPELAAADPENRLWGVAPRIRLDAETIRDSALYCSGLLEQQIGGRSVFPYQPAGLWEEISFNPAEYTAQTYKPSHGADLYRRGLYTFWKRTLPHPMMAIFDAPTREKCTVARTRTNTPQQSLVLMNEPTLIEAARHLAQRTMIDGGNDPRSRCSWMFRKVTSRLPTPEELDDLLSLCSRQTLHYQQHPAEANNLVTVGESIPNKKLNVAELAAWTTVANVLISLDEVITRN